MTTIHISLTVRQHPTKPAFSGQNQSVLVWIHTSSKSLNQGLFWFSLNQTVSVRSQLEPLFAAALVVYICHGILSTIRPICPTLHLLLLILRTALRPVI